MMEFFASVSIGTKTCDGDSVIGTPETATGISELVTTGTTDDDDGDCVVGIALPGSKPCDGDSVVGKPGRATGRLLLVTAGDAADEGDSVVWTLVAAPDIGDGVGGISIGIKPCDGDIVVGIPETTMGNSVLIDTGADPKEGDVGVGNLVAALDVGD